MGHATTSENGQQRGVVAVGASAGGVEALMSFAAGLPRELPFAVAIVLHMPPNAPSVLSKIIDRSGPLPAVRAQQNMLIEAGRVYVCAPDRHLVVEDHRFVLSNGPIENSYRPAINALFRSVALAYGPRAIGVLLSGVLDDGVLGLGAIQSRGGSTIVQQPADALYSAMPVNALHAGVAEHQACAADMGRLLMKLADREIEEHDMKRDARMELENRITMGRSLQAVGDGNFRCHVGHAWTTEALLRARDEEVEGALWVALRSLQEKAKLARRLAENARTGALFDRYNALADEADHAMMVLGDRLSTVYQEADERDAG